ncbi:YqgE/AlgH family protein [Lentilitoribacter sp. Alg239-R112]|uniref:YqgE/AlgH family protein n=1 Tax=Lentilitoribacter sp. Alg239-R112 TaxID=2305987 RepID=UPI001FCEBCD4|nr:YqgE/AlgH family protein [Lentilitoribacter sp. Alg239-R112]
MDRSNDILQRGGGYLENNLLIAMPGLYDTPFAQSVILICSHSDDGAMGFVLNKQSDILFSEFMQKLQVEAKPGVILPEGVSDLLPVHIGGPVDSGRGFVLHSDDYTNSSSMHLSAGLAVTATLDVLTAIAAGVGPKKAVLCLGYAGWSPGQLEEEIEANSWLSCPLNEEAVFDPDIDKIYTNTLSAMGVEAAQLSSFSGRA